MKWCNVIFAASEPFWPNWHADRLQDFLNANKIPAGNVVALPFIHDEDRQQKRLHVLIYTDQTIDGTIVEIDRQPAP